MRRLSALLSAFILVAAPAVGQAKGRRAARSEAKAKLAEGNRFMAEGRFAEAAEAYEAAHARYPSPKILYNLARALQSAGRPLPAWRRFSELLGAQDLAAARRGRIEAALRDLDAALGRVQLARPLPAEDAVQLDEASDRSLAAGEVVRVLPGPHVLRFERASAGTSVEVRLTVSAGQLRTVDVPDLDPVLEPPAPPAPPEPVAATEGGGGLFRQWWFWTAVGVGAGAAAVGYVATRDRAPNAPNTELGATALGDWLRL